jgi:hypothetical protein
LLLGVDQPPLTSEATMKTFDPTTTDTARSETAVREMLRDIGYVLWLSRMLAAEIKAEEPRPARPEMAEFCAVDAASFVA